MLTTNKELMKELNKVLTTKGKRWLAKYGFSDNELRYFLADTSMSNVYPIQHCCGAAVIEVENARLPYILGKMAGMLRDGDSIGSSASIFIATFNKSQEHMIPMFRQAGFRNQTAWVNNPNTNNMICAMTATLKSAFVKFPDDDRDLEDDIW